VLVAHAYNASYSGGRDQEDHSLKPAWVNNSVIPYLKKPFTKIGLVEWLKVKALSSSPSTAKNKKPKKPCLKKETTKKNPKKLHKTNQTKPTEETGNNLLFLEHSQISLPVLSVCAPSKSHFMLA
jgi:hypothetical protein